MKHALTQSGTKGVSIFLSLSQQISPLSLASLLPSLSLFISPFLSLLYNWKSVYVYYKLYCYSDNFMLRIYLFVCCCRYELLTPNVIPKGFMDGKKAVVEMVSSWVPNPKVSLCDDDGGQKWLKAQRG